MNYIPFAVATNLVEYWILMLTTQYICSAHLNLRRRNVFICSGIIAGCIASGMLLFGEDADIVSLPLAIVLSILLFSRKRLSDLLRFVAAFGIFLLSWSFLWGCLIRFFPEGFPLFSPAYLATDGSV